MYDLFEKFWSAYPRKVAKAAAFHEFKKAMTKTTLDVLLSAVESYKKHKPDYCDWAHARTWLHQERWEDEWEPPATIKPEPVVRPARSVDEVREFYRATGKTVTPEIARARTVEDLPVFARMIPVSWQPNVVKLRSA